MRWQFPHVVDVRLRGGGFHSHRRAHDIAGGGVVIRRRPCGLKLSRNVIAGRGSYRVRKFCCRYSAIGVGTVACRIGWLDRRDRLARSAAAPAQIERWLGFCGWRSVGRLSSRPWRPSWRPAASFDMAATRRVIVAAAFSSSTPSTSWSATATIFAGCSRRWRRRATLRSLKAQRSAMS
jgi:hypothetical protein